MSGFSSDKSALRASLIAARMALSGDARQYADEAIAQRARAWLAPAAPRILGVYWPLRGEPDLRALYAELREQGMELALPVASRRDAPLEFALWSPGEALGRDASGVPAPEQRRIVRPDALLIPCVGFTADGLRLGYGGGYYDRTLAAMPGIRTAGVAYDCTRTEFERGAHDIPLDVVITETLPPGLR